MRRKTELPELLSPAGSFDCLVAAVKAGADAVYVGGLRFGARAYARNFDSETMARAVCYCHLNGVKLYVTVNTLVEDLELSALMEYVGELYELGVDALIVADLGAVSLIRESFPDLPLHVSTQMSIHNTEGAIAAHRLGCERVVPARELSRENIKSIVENSPTEIEVFLHGALCVSHSGQCLFSSLVGGRSGNRGECAQPCRLPFEGGYPLSLRDLSLAEHIPELCELGVASLKIEGRMKSAAYVYTVTKIYRRLLDERRSANAEELALLRTAFSRGGFTDGYFTGRLGEGMTGIRSEFDKEETRAHEEGLGDILTLPGKTPLIATLELIPGRAATLTLSLKNDTRVSVFVSGGIPERAERAPLDEEDLKKRISRLDEPIYSLEPSDVTVITECAFMPVSAVNALRREAVAKLLGIWRRASRVRKPLILPEREASVERTVLHFMKPGVLGAICASGDDPRGFADIIAVPLFGDDSELSLADAVILPAVILDSEYEGVRARLTYAAEQGISAAVLGNIGHIKLALDAGLRVIGGFRFNLTNRKSRDTLRSLGVGEMILSPELTTAKARDIGGGFITYGRIPLMLTERCFITETAGCKRCDSAALVDRRGERFPMMREQEHRNLILNSAITYMGDKTSELDRAALFSRHLFFTVESPDEVMRALRLYRLGAPLEGVSIRRAGRRDSEPKRTEDGHTLPDTARKSAVAGEVAEKKDRTHTARKAFAPTEVRGSKGVTRTSGAKPDSAKGPRSNKPLHKGNRPFASGAKSSAKKKR